MAILAYVTESYNKIAEQEKWDGKAKPFAEDAKVPEWHILLCRSGFLTHNFTGKMVLLRTAMDVVFMHRAILQEILLRNLIFPSSF